MMTHASQKPLRVRAADPRGIPTRRRRQSTPLLHGRRRGIGTCRLSIAALWRNGRLVLQLRKLHPARLLLKCGIPKPVARQEKFQRLDLSKTTDKVHEIHPGHYSPGTDLAR